MELLMLATLFYVFFAPEALTMFSLRSSKA